jgi:hypothetical protein
VKSFIENDSTSKPAPRGDYELARAKRQLEKLLVQEGASKREALKQVSLQFNTERNRNECS